MKGFIEPAFHVSNLNPVTYSMSEYEILEPYRNSSSSIISDNMLNQIPTNLWGILKEEVSKMTNVIKFNIISNENKLNHTLSLPIQILHNKLDPHIETDKQKLNQILSNEFIWFSYRSNIDKMIYNNKLYQSDAGWGCMIRVGQMILAKGIIQLFQLNFESFYNSALYMFLDIPIPIDYLLKNITQTENDLLYKPLTNQKANKRIPYYSIQEICQTNPLNKKGPGDWFSNYDIISIFQMITKKYNSLPDIHILNFAEGTVYIKDIIEQCFEIATCNCIGLSFEHIIPTHLAPVKINGFEIIERSQCVKKICQCFKETYQFNNQQYKLKKRFLLFISVRHGLYEIEEDYKQSVFQFFDIQNNIGIIGGKNQRALYFIGYSHTNLICLDPHFVQQASDLPSIISGKSKESYKPIYYSIDISQLSSSFTLGLYCNSIEDFNTLITQMTIQGNIGNKLFSIKDQKLQYNYI